MSSDESWGASWTADEPAGGPSPDRTEPPPVAEPLTAGAQPGDGPAPQTPPAVPAGPPARHEPPPARHEPPPTRTREPPPARDEPADGPLQGLARGRAAATPRRRASARRRPAPSGDGPAPSAEETSPSAGATPLTPAGRPARPATPPEPPAPATRRRSAAPATRRTAAEERAATGDRIARPASTPTASPEPPAADRGPAARDRGADPGAGGISSATLLKATDPVPAGGWRRLVHQASGGRVNPRPTAAQIARESLLRRMRRPVGSCQHVAVVSLKGGVGKTTTAVCLGATLARARPDQVVVLDANPDRGSLADRLPSQTDLTVRDLLAALPRIRTYADLRHFTSQGTSRLESLASESDPAVSRAFGEDDFRQCATLLDRYYQVLVADSGTGLLHSAMAGVLGSAQHLVLVASPSVDGARSADATLDWLMAHGHGTLAARAVTVVSSVLPGGSDVDEGALRRHFSDRTRQVVAVPHDPHLAEGGEIDLEQLSPGTRDAYAELAAAVADAFV